MEGPEFIKADPGMFESCAQIIRDSFITVAGDFGLTRENAPTNAAFIEAAALEKMYGSGTDMYAVAVGGEACGFVAVEKAGGGVFYMEKLSVLPAFRHRGYGRAIMDFTFGRVRERGGQTVSIGIINENEVLKSWYLAYGFTEKETRVYGHLPFTVCIMEKSV